jgi:hypothetical protein
MPTCGNAAAMTALPQPAKVSQNVPIASAMYFFEFMTVSLLLERKPERGTLKAIEGWEPNFSPSVSGDLDLFRHEIPVSTGGHCRLCLIHPRAQG